MTANNHYQNQYGTWKISPVFRPNGHYGWCLYLYRPGTGYIPKGEFKSHDKAKEYADKPLK